MKTITDTVNQIIDDAQATTDWYFQGEYQMYDVAEVDAYFLTTLIDYLIKYRDKNYVKKQSMDK